MKKAVIIVYDGKVPPLQAQKDAANALAQYGIINKLENIEVYVLDEAEIAAAIVGKALSNDKENVIEFEKPEIWAANLIINGFKEALTSKDYDTFSVTLSIRLSSELPTVPNTDFIKAIHVLTNEGAENNLNDDQRVLLDDRVFGIIRRSFYLVCQGRHIIFR